MEQPYNIFEMFSYTLNLILLTWGLVALWKDHRKDKETANFFNSAYEMARRLANSLEGHAKHQAQDVASFLLSATMNFMKKKRNEISRIAKEEKQISWLKKFLKIKDK